jgi:hypothetical protein
MQDRGRVGRVIRDIGDNFLSFRRRQSVVDGLQAVEAANEYPEKRTFAAVERARWSEGIVPKPRHFRREGRMDVAKMLIKMSRIGGFLIEDDELGHAGDLPQNWRWCAVSGPFYTPHFRLARHALPI